LNQPLSTTSTNTQPNTDSCFWQNRFRDVAKLGRTFCKNSKRQGTEYLLLAGFELTATDCMFRLALHQALLVVLPFLPRLLLKCRMLHLEVMPLPNTPLQLLSLLLKLFLHAICLCNK
jgi:hypothetical protein